MKKQSLPTIPIESVPAISQCPHRIPPYKQATAYLITIAAARKIKISCFSY